MMNNSNSIWDMLDQMMNDDSLRGFAGQPQSSTRMWVNGQEVTPNSASTAMSGGRPAVNVQQTQAQNPKQPKDYLSEIGINVTEQARQGELDPVIGREQEIERLTQILSRRKKNNAVLLGDPGVGKTALIEGLAQAIVNGDVPENLANKEIWSIDLNSLRAGAGVAGQFEDNVQKLVDAVIKRQNVIVFFDEIHQILNSHTGGGNSDNAGNMLKPALARNGFQVIGATTSSEYHSTIEKDGALARRFQAIDVKALSAKKTFEVLQKVAPLYEAQHHVHFSDEVIRAAVELSERYIPERVLPDKAIDTLDELGAVLASKVETTALHQIDEKLADATTKEQQILALAAVGQASHENVDAARQTVKELEEQREQEIKQVTVEAKVSDVADLIERQTGIPVNLNDSDVDYLKAMPERLAGKVVGQAEAVKAVSQTIKRNRAGFNDSGRPVGSFLFVGPTGVGKTELAKSLAKDMFGDDRKRLIRLDMSEYMDKTSINKLVGASAGYVGYDEDNNTLVSRVRRQPYSIVLFDEIEKAHPDVLNALLQILDDGQLSDSKGKLASFKDAVIIATSNAGAKVELDDNGEAKVDSDKTKAQVIDGLLPYFKPEFLNRFDDIIEFHPLSKADLNQIIDIQIDNMSHAPVLKGKTLTVEQAVKDQIIDAGYNPEMGARPLRRSVIDMLQNPVADYVIDHPDDKNLQANWQDNQVVISAQ